MIKMNTLASALMLLSISITTYAHSSPLDGVNNQASIDLAITNQNINSDYPISGAKLSGNPWGVRFGITKVFFERLYAQLSLSALSGDLSYNNSYLDDATSYSQVASGRLGYVFYPTETIALIPYATLGFQNSQLDTGGYSVANLSVNGVTSFYQAGFVGIGLLGEWAAAQRLVLSLDTTAGTTIHPWVNFNAPTVVFDSAGDRTIVLQQANLSSEPFYQVGLSADYRLTQRVHARAGVEYNYQQISKASTTPSNLALPSESNSQWIYNLGLAYSFDDAPSDTPFNSSNLSGPIVNANNQAEFLFGVTDQSYSETIPNVPGYFDRQQGSGIYSLGLVFVKTVESLYLQAAISEGEGNTAYIGQLLNGESYDANTSNTVTDASVRIGYMFSNNIQKFAITPYVTAGYHRWLRDVDGLDVMGVNVNGYPETYQNGWIGAGLLAQYAVNPQWVLSIDGNIGSTVNASLDSWNSFYSPYTIEQNFSLGSEPFFSIGLGSDYAFASHWHFLAGLNFLQFSYGASDVSSLGINEPDSTTRQLMGNVGFGYSFD